LGIPENRHPGTKHFDELFAYSHLPEFLQFVSQPFSQLARTMIDRCPDGPELSACLRKILEAKDCAVRAAVTAQKEIDRLAAEEK
jgi:hypothetical protein